MKIEIKKNKKKKTWSYGEDSPVFSWLRHNKKKKKRKFQDSNSSIAVVDQNKIRKLSSSVETRRTTTTYRIQFRVFIGFHQT